jgi:hypothetical protein
MFYLRKPTNVNCLALYVPEYCMCFKKSLWSSRWASCELCASLILKSGKHNVKLV